MDRWVDDALVEELTEGEATKPTADDGNSSAERHVRRFVWEPERI